MNQKNNGFWLANRHLKQMGVNGWLENIHKDILQQEQERIAKRQKEIQAQEEIKKEIDRVVGKGIENAVKDVLSPLQKRR